jgi:hypothetical protein
MASLTITGAKQSDIIRALKHLLDLARSGRVAAIGFAVIQIDDDGLSSGTNAVWTDDTGIRDELKNAIATLKDRVAVKTGQILQ